MPQQTPEPQPEPEALVQVAPAPVETTGFRVDRDQFTQAVTWTAQSLPQRPSVPVLAGIRLDLADGQLRMSAYDYEVSAEATIPAESADTAKLLVPGRLLAEIARSLPADPVDVTVEGAKVIVVCGAARFTLLTMPVEDYPNLPPVPPVSARVDGRAFAAAVAQTAVAACKDAQLPMLAAVRMDIDGGTVTMAATDRYRLTVRDLAWQPAATGFTAEALVPVKALAAAAKTLAAVDEVEIALPNDKSTGLLGLSGGSHRITTRLLDSGFPKYESLVPTEFAAHADLPTGPFVEAVKRVALVAERETPVRLSFTEGEVTIEAGTGDEAQGVEKLPVDWVGDPLTIAFNPAYLLEGLGAVGAPKTRLKVTTPDKPAVLTGLAEAGEEVPGYLYLIMPVRLS